MAYFTSPDDLLISFYAYMDQREAMPLWRTKNYDLVLKPPSLVDWAKWLSESNIEGWEQVNYRILKKLSTLEIYYEVFSEIFAVIENDVIQNTLAGNYNTQFSQKYLQQKFSWDKTEMDDSKIQIVGLEAIQALLPDVPIVVLETEKVL